MIDANLRTLPDRANTLIAGSSMGGLMSLYAATAFNDVFGRAACLSPACGSPPQKRGGSSVRRKSPPIR